MAQLKEGSTVGGQEIAVLAHLKGESTINGNLIATKPDVDEAKDLIGGAITDVDDSVVIPTEPTFQQLANLIGSISTGKKWASGVGTAPTTSNDYFIVDNLDFSPSYVFAKIDSASYSIGMFKEDTYFQKSFSDIVGFYVSGTSYGRFNDTSGSINWDGFTLNSLGGNTKFQGKPVNWTAIE